MERRRRWLASLLALVLAAGLLPTAAWAEESAEEEKLSDETLLSSEDNVTRAQLAELIYDNDLLKMKIDLAAHGNEGTVPFTDLDGTNGENGCTDEQKTAITALYNAQMISGTSATEFSPDDEVCRGDAMLIIWRADGAKSNKTAIENPFVDEEGKEEVILPHWLPVATCFYAASLISGEGNSGNGPTFNGDGDLSVHEAYQFISRFNDGNPYYQTFLENTESGATTRAAMTVEFYNEFQAQLSSLPVASGREWSGNGPFNDISGCTEEQVTAIRFFYERGIISGTTTTTFTPYGPVSNLHLATLLQNCATASTETASGTQSVSLLSAMPLSEGQNELDAAFQFLIANGANEASVEAAGNNENAPALTNDLVSWSESLRPVEPTADNSNTTITSGQPLSVSLSCATEGAIIYYTVDSSDPATSETRQTYSATHVITISQPTVLRAVAVNNNLVSDELKLQYTYPALSLSASPTSLTGGGKVTLTVGGTAEETQVSVTCTSHTGVAIGGSGNVYTVDLPNADGTYTFIASAAGYTTASCTVTVRRYTSSSSGSSSSSSNTTTSTERNPDGSTTTTTTNKTTGTVTETTRYPDGSQEVVETKKDGTVTTTSTDADGNETAVTENPDGSSETTIQNADGSSSTTAVSEDGAVETAVKLPSSVVDDAEGAAIALPMPAVRAERDREDAPTVTVDLPRNASVPVEIPVENAGTSTVAVLVKADGTEEVIKTSLTTENGVAVSLSDGDTVKIVDNGKTFYDVPGSHWGAEAIDFVTSRELFGGTSAVTFEPDVSMNRGMLVTVLYRLENELNTWGGGSYTDVPEGMYYTGAVAWADVNGIVTGYADATFAPGKAITREEMAVVLYRYAQHKGYDTDQGGMALREYADYGRISAYALEAMVWANASGLITGDGGMLNPQGSATRAQVATILQRFLYLING